jgi:hypothetical protein
MSAKKVATTLAEFFLRSFGDALSDSGFRRVPKKQTFHRVSPEGWYGIQVPSRTYSDRTVRLELVAAIRFHAVEELVVRLTASPMYTDGPNRGTLGLFLANDAPEALGLFQLYDLGDVPPAVVWAVSKFERQARPFFDAFPRLAAALDAMAAPEVVSAKFDFPSDVERAKRVLAAAVALGRAGDLEHLVEAQRMQLAKSPQAIVADFDAFVRRLKDHCGDG